MAVYTVKNSGRNSAVKAVNLWTEVSNPLRYLTRTKMQTMLQDAKFGNDAYLQVAFYEMERITPIYGIVMQRRLSGIQKKEWKISPVDEENETAIQQAERINEMFKKADGKNLHGLSEAIRHLSLAVFRGRSVVKPFVEEDGSISFYNMDNWNVLEWRGKLYFAPNPEGVLFAPTFENGIPDGVDEIPEGEVAWLKEERPIDIPGIEVYLRQLVGEEAWARAVERYGLAPVVITAPDGTPDSALPTWAERAMRIYEGGSGVLPPGAKVDAMTDARGQDPFTSYVQHQTEQIVLLACGSTLGTLAGSTGLGSGLAELQKETFDSLVDYDCKRIGNALTECAVKKAAKALGYKELLCRFEFMDRDERTGEEYLNLAEKAKNLGLKVDWEALKKLSPDLSFLKVADVPAENGLKSEEWSPMDEKKEEK